MLAWLLTFTAILLTFYVYRRSRKPKSIAYFPVLEPERKLCLEYINSLPTEYSIPTIPLTPLNPSTILYVQTPSQLQSILPSLQSSSHIGVDIEEYRSNSYLGYICLLQLSTTNFTYLVDALSLRKEILTLKPIFMSKNITKIFHHAHNDTQWLQRDFGILCVNVFDTQLAAQSLGYKKLGLNYLWKKHCGYVMSSEYKKTMQVSRWDKRPLSQEQQNYAALDAHYMMYLMGVMCKLMSIANLEYVRKETNKICAKEFSNRVDYDKCLKAMKKNSGQAIDSQNTEIFFKIFKMRDELAQKLNAFPESICSTTHMLFVANEKNPDIKSFPIEFTNSILCKKYLNEIVQAIKNGLEIPLEIPRDPLDANQQRIAKKQKRYNTFIEKYTIKKKVYENCQIQAPDGEILCYADMKKTKWYVERQLAEIVSENPLIIRLNFEPNGRGFSDVEADQMHYSKEKRNECVGCGSTTSYLRYHVVPVLYRQFFPDNYKSHRSHDVVLLCSNCHQIANKHSDVLKKQIAKEYGIPLNFYSDMHKAKESIYNVRKLCLSILKNKERIPEDRKMFLESKVQDFINENPQYNIFFEGLGMNEILNKLSKEEYCKEILKVYGEFNWKKDIGNAHGKKVVEKLTDLKSFIRRWRVHFISTLQPRFLPDSWSVDHLLNSPKFK